MHRVLDKSIADHEKYSKLYDDVRPFTYIITDGEYNNSCIIHDAAPAVLIYKNRTNADRWLRVPATCKFSIVLAHMA